MLKQIICLNLSILLLALPNFAAANTFKPFNRSLNQTASTDQTVGPDPAELKSNAIANYQHRKLSFELNRGQIDSAVKYYARTQSYDAFITSSGLVLNLFQSHDKQQEKIKNLPLRMEFVGAQTANVVGVEQLPGKKNYYQGNNAKSWVNDIPNYAMVRMENIYQGIDALFYQKDGKLEYDLMIAPGVDPSAIAIKFEGADKVSISESGNLELRMADEQLLSLAPITFQQRAGDNQSIISRYKLNQNGTVGFEIGQYDQTKTLTIDPVIQYNRFIGGEGMDIIKDVIYNPSEQALFIVGSTSSPNFPNIIAQYSPINVNSEIGLDIFVTKIDVDGQIIQSTIFGSTKQQDYALGLDATISLDPKSPSYKKFNHIYVVGRSEGMDMPLIGNNPSPYHGGIADGFLAVVSGYNGTLEFSGYLGGKEEDSAIGIDVVEINKQTEIYITGSTTSPDLPATNGFVTTLTNTQTLDPDGFLMRVGGVFNELQIKYCTYMGARGLKVAADYSDPTQAYVFGHTSKPLFYNDPVSPISDIETYQGGSENFLLKAATDKIGKDSLLDYIYVGGEGDESYNSTGGIHNEDNIGDLYYDGIHNLLYLCGTAIYSDGTMFATGFFREGNSLASSKVKINGESDVYVRVYTFDKGFSVLDSKLVGGKSYESGSGIAVMKDVNNKPQVIITGLTLSEDFPKTTNNIVPITPSTKCFITVLDLSINNPVVFSTILGALNVSGVVYNASVKGVAPVVRTSGASNNQILVVGNSQPTDFVTTNPGQVPSLDDSYNGGPMDGFLLQINMK